MLCILQRHVETAKGIYNRDMYTCQIHVYKYMHNSFMHYLQSSCELQAEPSVWLACGALPEAPAAAPEMAAAAAARHLRDALAVVHEGAVPDIQHPKDLRRDPT